MLCSKKLGAPQSLEARIPRMTGWARRDGKFVGASRRHHIRVPMPQDMASALRSHAPWAGQVERVALAEIEEKASLADGRSA